MTRRIASVVNTTDCVTFFLPAPVITSMSLPHAAAAAFSATPALRSTLREPHDHHSRLSNRHRRWREV